VTQVLFSNVTELIHIIINRQYLRILRLDVDIDEENLQLYNSMHIVLITYFNNITQFTI